MQESPSPCAHLRPRPSKPCHPPSGISYTARVTLSLSPCQCLPRPSLILYVFPCQSQPSHPVPWSSCPFVTAWTKPHPLPRRNTILPDNTTWLTHSPVTLRLWTDTEAAPSLLLQEPVPFRPLLSLILQLGFSESFVFRTVSWFILSPERTM